MRRGIIVKKISNIIVYAILSVLSFLCCFIWALLFYYYLFVFIDEWSVLLGYCEGEREKIIYIFIREGEKMYVKEIENER